MESLIEKIESIESTQTKPTAPFAGTSKYAANQIINILHPPANSMNIPFANMSHSAYNPKDDYEGYTLHKGYSSPDRAVYVRDDGSHVVIAFRGTELHQGKHKAFRDIGTDILAGLGLESVSSRFKHAEDITKTLIQKYGKDRVFVTGHSLGGAQAMHVSNKYGVHAEVYNPFINVFDVESHRSFPNTVVHYNVGDPVAVGTPFIKTKKTYYHLNTNPKVPSVGLPMPFGVSGINQHSIDNLITPHSKSKPKPPIKTEVPKPKPTPVVTKPKPTPVVTKPKQLPQPQIFPTPQDIQQPTTIVQAPSRVQPKPKQVPIQQQRQSTTSYKPSVKTIKRSKKPKQYFGLSELIYT